MGGSSHVHRARHQVYLHNNYGLNCDFQGRNITFTNSKTLVDVAIDRQAKRAHVFNTCARFAATHGSVFERSRRRRLEPTHGGPLSLSLAPLVLSSFSLPSFPSFVLFLFSFSSLSVTMTMIARLVGSLCVHTALTCPKLQSAWTWAQSLSGRACLYYPPGQNVYLLNSEE